MKKLLLILSLFCCFGQAKAQFTSPNLGLKFTMSDLLLAGAATQTGGEYFITQALTLETTDTLYIPTNETIKVGPGILLTIKGALIISPPDSVKITASAANWHTLKFDGSSKVSNLKKLIIEKSSGIRVLNASVNIDSCIVRNNDRINQSGAIYVSGALPVTISNSKIYRNARAGVMSPTNGATVTIRNNWFFENGTDPGLYPQINLGPTSAGPIVITGNTITGIQNTTNRSGGIAIANLLGNTTVTNCLIANNTVRFNSYGVGITGGNIHGYIKSNLLENNNVNPNTLTTGSGINFNTVATNQKMIASRNIIRNNYWGVTIQSGTGVAAGPKPSLGNLASADTADVGLNRIYNNFNTGTTSGQIWDLYNNTTDSIFAENNFWGTTNLTDIEDHIYHKTDNAVHGFVDYLPIMQTTGIAKNVVSKEVKLYPNPAQDVVKIAANAMLLTSKTTVKFYNALGQEVLAIQPKTSTNYLEVNTQKLAVGIYSYRIENNNSVATGKLVISK